MPTFTYNVSYSRTAHLKDAIKEKFPAFSGEVVSGSGTITIIANSGISDADKPILDGIIRKVCGRKICFNITLAGFKQPTDNLVTKEVCVDLAEPVATWFERLLLAEKEELYHKTSGYETFEEHIEQEFARRVKTHTE